VITRRIPMLAVTVAAAAGILVAARSDPATTAPGFARAAAPWMPAVPAEAALTSTWFCPGVPATGEDETGGEFVISNAGPAPVTSRVTLLGGEGQATVRAVEVPAYDQVTVDADEIVTAPYVGAVVEIDGGGGLVEQRAVHEAGASVAPCTTSTSSEWYFAEGFTAGDSTEHLVLMNPYERTVIVDVGFATAEVSRVPLEGHPIPARSVEVIDVASLAARDEERVAVRVDVQGGASLIAGRAQHDDGGGRLGYTMTLGAPVARSQWWFANGLKGEGITQRFSVYNPTDEDVQVQPLYLGIPAENPVLVDPITVPAGEVVTYSSDGVAGLPDGRHAILFDSQDAGRPFVVERVLTRTIEGVPTTSVLLGGMPRDDAFVPTAWTLAIGPGEPTEDALIVYNTTNAAGTVTVQAVTPDGLQNVAGLDAVTLPAAGIATIPLTAGGVTDTQLVIQATAPVFVERSLPREPGARGRSAAWAVPVVG
jgi:hypothetical protein